MSSSSWCRALAAIAALIFTLPAAATAAPPAKKSGSLTEVGHEPLMNRGMNAALAVKGDFVYVGSRTDGGHEGMPHGGIMIVDVSDPSDPTLVAGPLDAHPGESSRELRIWRSQDVLIVLNTNCGVGDLLHHCTQPSVSNFRFYDISGANATQPRFLSQINVNTHEFFLWVDPNDPDRALIFAGNANPNPNCTTTGGAPTCPLEVWDISGVPDGNAPVSLYGEFGGPHGFTEAPAAGLPTGGLHSLSISNDGSRAYYAILTGGFGVVDVSDFSEGRPFPAAAPDHRQREPPALVRTGSAQRDQALGPRLGLGLGRGLRHRHGRGTRLPVGLGADDRHLRSDHAHRRG